MLIYNIDYEISGIIIEALLLFFISVHYTGTYSVKEFKKVILLNLLAASLDALTVYFYTYPGLIPDSLNYLINSCCFIAGAVCSYAIVQYIKIYVAQKASSEAAVKGSVLGLTILVIYSALFVINAFRPFIFTFDEAGNYMRVGIYPIVFVVPMAFVIFSNYYIFAKRKYLTVGQMMAMLIYTIFMILGTGLQFFFFPDIFLSYFFSSLAILSMTFTLETPDYINLMKTMRELSEAKEEAESATKAKDSFLANMSHEIRTPLNSILGLDEIIIRESKDAKTLLHAKRIKSAGNTLLAIINDILDLSKIESGKMELVNVEYATARIIEDVSNMTRVKANDKHLALKINISEDFPSRLYGDEVRIRQVMLNLVNNAIKYTQEGGIVVDVSYSIEKAENPSKRDIVKITAKVKDTGIGIRQEDIHLLFESFRRLDEKKNRHFEGTGLGLALTKQFVELMGGTVEVESVYGKGSTFTVNIEQECVDATGIGNLRMARIIAVEEEKEYEPKLYAPKARVLVVDDNEMNLQVFAELLSITEIDIDIAESGAESIELCRKKEYDVIFMDRMMPEMNGIETLQNLRGEDLIGDTPVIMLTADAIIGSREKYMAFGFDDYMTKPVKYENLEKLLFTYLPKSKVEDKPAEDKASSENATDGKMTGEKPEIQGGTETQAKESPAAGPSLVVIDGSKEKLDEHRKLLQGYKATMALDEERAGKYMEKHDVDYVMISMEEYKKLVSKC